jgi:HEPN domain-containing protein
MPTTGASIANWIESSDYDIETAAHMFKTKRYVYVLFMCHLATEKLLKALVKAFTRERVSEYLTKTKSLLKWLKQDKRLRR